jgi:hypothetical protein
LQIDTTPTIGCNQEAVKYKTLKMNVVDMGGRESVRVAQFSFHMPCVNHRFGSWFKRRCKTTKLVGRFLVWTEAQKSNFSALAAYRRVLNGYISTLRPILNRFNGVALR